MFTNWTLSTGGTTLYGDTKVIFFFFLWETNGLGAENCQE